MFTIKFMSFFQGEESTETVISAPHYEVYTHTNGVKTVCAYKDFISIDGVARTVMSDNLADELDLNTPYYHVCYIENMAGKTIARIQTQ